MMYKTAGLLVILVTMSLWSTSVLALETTEIEKISKKTVLEKADLDAIDQFVAAGIGEIENTEDFGSVASIRAALLAYTNSTASIQYRPQYSAASVKYLKAALEKAKTMADTERQPNVILNLMILADNLHDSALNDIVMQWISYDNAAIRYWAIHALTNNSAVEQFNSKSGSARAVCDKLDAQLKNETSPEIVEQIARFGAVLNAPQAMKLLTDIADERIKKYETWTVDYIPLDGTVLSLLAGKMDVSQLNSPVAARFGQLYSYVMQRYYKDKSIAAPQKEQLAAVMVQTEAKSLGKLGIVQTSIKRAIEKGSAQLIAAEHSALFGEQSAVGKLAISYSDGKGGTRVSPLVLGEQPEQVTQK